MDLGSDECVLGRQRSQGIGCRGRWRRVEHAWWQTERGFDEEMKQEMCSESGAWRQIRYTGVRISPRKRVSQELEV